MFTQIITAALWQSTDDGLTLREVVDNIPTDPASVTVSLLLMASLAFVLWSGSRGSRPGGRGGRAT